MAAVSSLNLRTFLIRSAAALLFVFLLVSCASQVVPEGNDRAGNTVETEVPTASPLETVIPANTPSPTLDRVSEGDQAAVADQEDPTSEQVEVATANTALNSADWKDLPVIPEISERAREIYKAGIEAGNDPRVFAKVGDCQNVPSMFLSIFDYPGYFSLGEEYGYLQETIDWYEGSFSRESEAVRRGFNAASVVSPVWADPEACQSGETPLACEIRVNNPSVAIISLETWWAGNPENYEKYVRQIIEGLLEHDILPIVATKADNLEGDHRINEILVGLAEEYQLPVWNFWRAVQPLPGNGLMEDRFHLTFDENQFDDPDAMQAAWPWRNLTALQVLDRVRVELAQPE